jgi:hypothetical protein
MPTLACNHEGCQKTFTHLTQKSAEHALHVHTYIKHGRRVTPPAPASGRIDGSAIKLEPLTPLKIDRRSKAWRQANPEQAKKIGNIKAKKQAQAPVAKAVNYCPCCGCNIQKVAVGMVLAERM